MGALVLVSGEKGGVGKSFVAASLTDWVWHRLDHPVVVIECNAEIPDVGRRFTGDIPVYAIEVRREGGWARFADVVDDHPDAIVIANLPGSVEQAFPDDRAAILNALRVANDIPVILAWVLSHERDGILALRREIELLEQPIDDVVVVANEYHERFDCFAWTSSNVRSEYLARDVQEIRIPKLWTTAANVLRDSDVSYTELRNCKGQLSAGMRMTLWDYIRRTDRVWEPLAQRYGWLTEDAVVDHAL